MKIVPENLNEINFERGKSENEIKEIISNRILTVELDANNVSLTENGELDMDDEDTKYFYETSTSRGAKIEPMGQAMPYGVLIKIKGTKEQIIPALRNWDAWGRDLEEFEEAMEVWNPTTTDLDEETLWEIMT